MELDPADVPHAKRYVILEGESQRTLAQSALSEGTSTARHEAILEGEPTGRYSDDLVTTELYTYQWVGMERSLPIELQVGPARCQS